MSRRTPTYDVAIDLVMTSETYLLTDAEFNVIASSLTHIAEMFLFCQLVVSVL